MPDGEEAGKLVAFRSGIEVDELAIFAPGAPFVVPGVPFVVVPAPAGAFGFLSTAADSSAAAAAHSANESHKSTAKSSIGKSNASDNALATVPDHDSSVAATAKKLAEYSANCWM